MRPRLTDNGLLKMALDRSVDCNDRGQRMTTICLVASHSSIRRFANCITVLCNGEHCLCATLSDYVVSSTWHLLVGCPPLTVRWLQQEMQSVVGQGSPEGQ
jgi:hypothetical protein